jgi:hypothetical protein
MHELKKGFYQAHNSESWEHATEEFPKFAQEEQLKRFLGCNLKKGIPTSFQEFCRHAKIKIDHQESIFNITASESGPSIIVNVLCSKFEDITGHSIQSIQPSFTGVDLAMLMVECEVIVHGYILRVRS